MKAFEATRFFPDFYFKRRYSTQRCAFCIDLTWPRKYTLKIWQQNRQFWLTCTRNLRAPFDAMFCLTFERLILKMKVKDAEYLADVPPPTFVHKRTTHMWHNCCSKSTVESCCKKQIWRLTLKMNVQNIHALAGIRLLQFFYLRVPKNYSMNVLW